METAQVVRSRKNPPEQIVDNTPPTPFISPLQRFILENCRQCTHFGGLCRENDSRGLTPMSLCIHLYTAAPPDVNKILQEAMNGLRTTQKTAELTLEEAEK